MAITITNLKRIAAGNHARIVGTMTGPASYNTGGELLTAAQISQLTSDPMGANRSTTSLASVRSFDSETEPANFRQLVLDRTNLKIKFAAGATEVASTTNLSTVSINFEAIVLVSNG